MIFRCVKREREREVSLLVEFKKNIVSSSGIRITNSIVEEKENIHIHYRWVWLVMRMVTFVEMHFGFLNCSEIEIAKLIFDNWQSMSGVSLARPPASYRTGVVGLSPRHKTGAFTRQVFAWCLVSCRTGIFLECPPCLLQGHAPWTMTPGGRRVTKSCPPSQGSRGKLQPKGKGCLRGYETSSLRPKELVYCLCEVPEVLLSVVCHRARGSERNTKKDGKRWI